MPRSGGTRGLICEVGPYAGELIHYPVHIAEALLDSGQAREPTDDERDAGGVVAEAAVALEGEVRDAAPELETDEAGPEEALPEWPLKTTPEKYLETYGDDAKNSELARRVIAARE